MLLICVLADLPAADEFACAVCVLWFGLFVCAISRRLCAGPNAISNFVHAPFDNFVRVYEYICDSHSHSAMGIYPNFC